MSQRKQPTSLVFFVKIVLLAALFTVGETSAAKSEDASSGASIVKSFQPPVEFDSKQMDVSEVAVRHFDFIGEVFMVSSDGSRIVVYDTSFNIAPGAQVSGVREGMTVGLKLNNSREVTAVERLSLRNN